jgi:hypothetical protein
LAGVTAALPWKNTGSVSQLWRGSRHVGHSDAAAAQAQAQAQAQANPSRLRRAAAIVEKLQRGNIHSSGCF